MNWSEPSGHGDDVYQREGKERLPPAADIEVETYPIRRVGQRCPVKIHVDCRRAGRATCCYPRQRGYALLGHRRLMLRSNKPVQHSSITKYPIINAADNSYPLNFKEVILRSKILEIPDDISLALHAPMIAIASLRPNQKSAPLPRTAPDRAERAGDRQPRRQVPSAFDHSIANRSMNYIINLEYYIAL